MKLYLSGVLPPEIKSIRAATPRKYDMMLTYALLGAGDRHDQKPLWPLIVEERKMGLFKAEKVEGEKSPLYGKYVILVGCGKSKKAVRSPAAELYTGGLTRMSVEWARRNSDKFFILSAKWSLLHPDEMVSPYNVKMSDLDKDERKAWGGTVKDQMMVHKIDDLNFVVLAGGDYLNALRFKPRNIVYAPMDGLKMGERMKWLKENPVLKKKLLGDRHGAES